MAEVILHIGTHKTGTTTFQHWLRHSAKPLTEAGVTPFRGLIGQNHVEFPMLALNVDRSMPNKAKFPDWCLSSWQREARNNIAAQMDGPASRLLVSAEGLSYLRHDDELLRLAELCAPREIRVILVRRDPEAFLASYRDTLARMGFNPSPYPESFAYVEADSWLVDYDAIVTAYRRIAAPTMIHVIDYETAVAEHGSIIPAVASAAEIDLDNIPVDGTWQNVSTVRPGRWKTQARVAHRWLPPALVPIASRLAAKTKGLVRASRD